jgi:hypothetical protein
MLDFRLPDANDDAGSASPEIVVPFMFAEYTERLGYRLVDTLRADLDRVFDALVSRQVTLQVRTAIRRKYHIRHGACGAFSV